MSQFSEGSEVAGRFVVLDPIGEGGMGAVYRALQTSLDREVALKVLHSQVAFTPRARRRFGREARAVARLNHPHIAAVYDFGTDNDDQTLWLAMELVEGSAMTGLKRQQFDILRLLSLTDQILSALSAAHARGIIHRDLKPSNVLLAEDDEGHEIIKLVDFGLAATQEGDLSLENAPGGLGDDASESQSRVIMGTPRYMAPEIFRRKPVDPRVDLYALGVILFEIISGKPPYPGDDPRVVMRGHLKQPIPQLVAREGIDVPSELERIIYDLLAKDPDERFQSASEVREEIMAIIGNYSYVPWATGPALGNNSVSGNLSRPGFLSAFGGQTIPPVAMAGGSRPGFSSATTPLVGRSQERRQIEQQIRNTIRSQNGGIVTIEGEGGMGKSRLTQWVRVRVDESGLMRPVSGEYSRNGGGFDGVRSMLDQILGTSEMTYEEMPFAIKSRLQRWGFSQDEIDTTTQLMRPGGDSFLFDGTGPASDARVSQQERVFAVVERILRTIAEERPLLITLESLQDAGETTYAFLEHLAVGMHLNPAPVLIVVTINTEGEVPPSLTDTLQRLGRFGVELTRIQISRMSLDESQALVQQLLPLSDDLAGEIAARSAGNPLHLTQMLRYLQESEKLFFANGKWQLAPGVDIATEVPTEMIELMRYRAERVAQRYLDPDALKAVLMRCAIIGNRFDFRLLNGFVSREADPAITTHLDSALEYLVREGVLREVGHSAEDMLEFSHSIMRDVLLNDMENDRSARNLQVLAAETKIAAYRHRVNEHALEIAEHFRRARDPQNVYIFTVKAARSAMNSSDLDAAIKLFRDAMELAESDPGIEDTLDEAQQGLTEISSVMRTEEVSLEVAHLELKVGEYTQARSHYRALLRSTNREVAAWARWGLGELARVQGELDEAVGWFEAAVRESETLRSNGLEATADRVEAHSLYGLGDIAFSRGELSPASESLSSALETARKQDEKVLETRILRVLSDIVWKNGDPDTSDIYRRRATMLAEGLGDHENLAHSMLHAATYLQQIGQPGRAEEQAQAAMAIFEERGNRHAYAHCVLCLGHLGWCRGDFKSAAAKYREAHRLYEGFDDRRGITRCKLRLAELAFSIKKFRESQTLLRDALEGYRSMGDKIGIAKCKLLAGRIELEVEKFQNAKTTFRSVFEDMESRGDSAGLVQTMTLEALALEHLGEHDTVDSLLEDVFERVKTVPVAQEGFATALVKLSELLNQRRPDLALQTDTLADEAWHMLGRPRA